MAELPDERPSLAPIRTARSRSCCHYHEASTGLYRTCSSCSLSFPSPHKPAADHHSQSSQSPSSSSSSNLTFLHSSSFSLSRKNHGLLAKCLAPRPSHGFLTYGSPRQDLRKAHTGSGRIFRSVASFPGQGSRLGSSTISGSCDVPATPMHYSAPLKLGYSSSFKGHLANMNAFTMIPATVVGKKKPLDYTSDDPTSPEVTCIGRVKKSKPSKSTWDALLNSSEKLCKKKKALRKQLEHRAARRINSHQGLRLASIPKPLSYEPLPKWNKMISFFKESKNMLSHFYGQRKLRQEDLVINLSHLHVHCSAENCLVDETGMRCNAGDKMLRICRAGDAREDDRCSTISQEEAKNDLAHVQTSPTHPNYMLTMCNMSGRSKVFHNHDDSSSGCSGGAPASRACDPNPTLKIISTSAGAYCQTKWNKKQGFSLWKSRKLFFTTSTTS